MTRKKITTDDFDRLLVQVIDDDNGSPSDLLSVPGVYEILSEHYNNAVLEEFQREIDDETPEFSNYQE